MLVDSHCHLEFPDFAEEVDEIVERAHSAGVGLMVTISTKVSEIDKVLSVAERFPHVVCTVGVHPHEAESEKTSLAELKELAAHPKVVGIGETGLDFYYDHSPRDLQEESFRMHIAAARELELPLIVHARDADQRTAEVLEDEMSKGAFTGLMHCFSSGPELAARAMKLGFYISISGIITFKKADELRAIVEDVPLERLLVETDAPYLAPVPKRGKRNEPSFVTHTAAKVAELKHVSAEELASVTTANFLKLFTRVHPSALKAA